MIRPLHKNLHNIAAIKIEAKRGYQFSFCLKFFGEYSSIRNLKMVRQFRQTVPAVAFFWVEGLLTTHNL